MHYLDIPDDPFTKAALTRVNTFIANHPEFTIQGIKQPTQGATNRVYFARRGTEQVVIKVFVETERKVRECFGLRHWRHTGLVPRLILDEDNSPAMIVTEYLPGTHLLEVRYSLDEASWQQACRETGQAAAGLVQTPLQTIERSRFEDKFYNGLGNLGTYLGRIIELGRSLSRLDRDFSNPFWRKNLDFCQEQLIELCSQPQVLYHQDIGNHMIWQGHFKGFFDLEMCRVGGPAMQLASALMVFWQEKAAWRGFQAGWESASGTSLALAERKLAAAGTYLLCWREITRYLSYDGTPGTGYSWAKPADPAETYARITAVENLLEIE